MKVERPFELQHETLTIRAIMVENDRLPVDETVVQGLMASIREIGLVNPITIFRVVGMMPRLIAGNHRLEACRRLKMDTIKCRVVNEDTPEVRHWAELVEIDENLIRRDLTAAQRAKLVSQRKKAYLQAHPETKKGGDRQTDAGKLSAKMAGSFVADTASKTGKPTRTIERDVTRGHRLGSDLDRIAGTSLDKGTELDALARLTPAERAPIIESAALGNEVSAVSRSKQLDQLTKPRKRRTQYVNNGFRLLNALDVLRTMPLASKMAAKLKPTQRGAWIAKELHTAVDWLNALRLHLEPDPAAAAAAIVKSIYENASPADRVHIWEAVNSVDHNEQNSVKGSRA